MWDTLIRPIQNHLPLWLFLLPILGMVLLSVTHRLGHEAVRRTMLVNLLTSALLSVWLVVAYEPLKPPESANRAAMLGPLERFQFRDRFAWVGETRTALLDGTIGQRERRVVELPIQWGTDIGLEVGVDGISIWFVALSVLVIAIGASIDLDHTEVRSSAPEAGKSIVGEHIAWLWLEASLVGTFVALDVVFFVICWMSSFASVAWLMGRHGDSQRHEVTPRLLKRTWLAGWLTTLGLSGLVLVFGWLRPSPNRMEAPLLFSIPELVVGIGQVTSAGEGAFLWASINTWLFYLLVIGFSTPLWLVPFHRGFVEAINCAPSGIGIVLIGILLKNGVYGWLRFVAPLFPELLSQHAEAFITFFGFSGLTAAVFSFGAREWRNRIALMTVSSMCLSLLGIVTLTIEGMIGGTLRLLSHGLTAALLIYVLPHGVNRPLITEAANPTRQDNRRRLLRLALFACIGMPGFSGFVAEFVTPFGLFQHESNAAAFSLATSGLLAWMWVRSERDQPSWSRENWPVVRSWVAASLIALNVAFGVAPQFVVNRLQPSLLSLLHEGRATSGAPLSVPPITETR